MAKHPAKSWGDVVSFVQDGDTVVITDRGAPPGHLTLHIAKPGGPLVQVGITTLLKYDSKSNTLTDGSGGGGTIPSRKAEVIIQRLKTMCITTGVTFVEDGVVYLGEDLEEQPPPHMQHNMMCYEILRSPAPMVPPKGDESPSSLNFEENAELTILRRALKRKRFYYELVLAHYTKYRTLVTMERKMQKTVISLQQVAREAKDRVYKGLAEKDVRNVCLELRTVRHSLDNLPVLPHPHEYGW